MRCRQDSALAARRRRSVRCRSAGSRCGGGGSGHARRRGGSGRFRRDGLGGRLLRRRLFRSRLGGRFRRGLGGGRSGRLGCRLRGGLGCGRFRSRLRSSLGCRLGRRFRCGLRSRFGGGLGCRLGGRGLRCRFFRRGFRRRLGGGLGCRFSCRLGRCGFRRGLAAGFAAGLAAAFAAGLTLTPVSFSICLVSVSTLPCSSFTSLRLGTPRREMALFRRLSKASSSSLHLPSARSRTSSTLLFAERAEAFAAPTCASTSDFASFSAFSPSFTKVSNSLLPSLLTFE
ncbi:Uncharacterised protein [Pseudomonas aeruginosa]|nr:Uncharacterised protein [Pseudomonas aeruginosa]